eukprot:m51a1_g12164 hypothetical protein (584) ;mRNA; f:46-2754
MGKRTGGGQSSARRTLFGIRGERVDRTPPDELYAHAEDDRRHAEAALHVFDPAQWSAAFSTATPATRKGLRRIVQLGTVEACLRGSYRILGGGVVGIPKQAIRAAACGTSLHVAADDDPAGRRRKASATTAAAEPEVMLCADDSLEVALWLKRTRGLNPAVLNMASGSNPGGGWKNESIHRRSALFSCLEDPLGVAGSRGWSYPLPEFGCLYSPDVPVFRRSESRGYAFTPSLEHLSIISASAYAQPPTERDPGTGDDVLTGKTGRGMLRKAANVLAVACEHGHDAVVLSAWGCGAYGCPASASARSMAEAVRARLEVEILARHAHLNAHLDELHKPFMLFTSQLFGSGKSFFGTHAIDILADDFALRDGQGRHTGPVTLALLGSPPSGLAGQWTDRCSLSALRRSQALTLDDVKLYSEARTVHVPLDQLYPLFDGGKPVPFFMALNAWICARALNPRAGHRDAKTAAALLKDRECWSCPADVLETMAEETKHRGLWFIFLDEIGAAEVELSRRFAGDEFGDGAKGFATILQALRPWIQGESRAFSFVAGKSLSLAESAIKYQLDSPVRLRYLALGALHKDAV